MGSLRVGQDWSNLEHKLMVINRGSGVSPAVLVKNPISDHWVTLNMWPDLLDFSLWLCKLEIIIVPAHRGLSRALSEWIYETQSTWLALNFICSIYYYWHKYFLQDSCSEKKVLDSVAKDPPHFPHRYSPTWRLPRVASSSVSTLPQWNTVPSLPQETAVAMNETVLPHCLVHG